MAGTTNSYRWDIVVPGGRRLPQAAVTHVGVPAVHARRGVGRALMAAQLRMARAAGEPIATLRATEATIYGHFGYAVASLSADFEIDRRRAALRPGLAGGRPLRLVAPDAAWALQARIYAAQPDPRPGTISRPARWWRGPAAERGLAGQTWHLVACGPEGAETGYVRYRPLPGQPWVDNTERTIIVDDLVAHGDADEAALIGYLLSIDIAHRILLPVRPEDDPLPWMLTDWRGARLIRRLDETWLRLLDTERALAARGYQPGEAVVLEVVDALLPENTVRLRIGPGGVARTAAEAAAVVDVAAASAAYLGGVAWWQLAAAGRLMRASPAAVDALDRLFATPRKPFSGTMF